jgi:hypothetical protein
MRARVVQQQSDAAVRGRDESCRLPAAHHRHFAQRRRRREQGHRRPPVDQHLAVHRAIDEQHALPDRDAQPRRVHQRVDRRPLARAGALQLIPRELLEQRAHLGPRQLH